MPWSETRPTTTTAAKYRTPEHRAYCAGLKQDLQRMGHLVCTADVCVFGDRTITNSNGNDRDGLTAGHAPDGVHYSGPQHRACNTRDGSVRGAKRSHGVDTSNARVFVTHRVW